MSRTADEEDEDECFHDSLDRIASSSCSCSEAEDGNESDSYHGCSPNHASFSAPRFPMADIWTSEPASVSERRSRLLREMGLAADPSLSRVEMVEQISTASGQLGHDGFARSESLDGCSSDIVQSKFDDAAQCNNYTSVCSPSINLIGSIGKAGSFVNTRNGVDREYQTHKSNGSSLPNKPPTGKNCRKMDGDFVGLNGNLGYVSVGVGEVIEDSEINGSESVCDQVCTIKNLDTGKEFVVKEIREDGMWNKLKEVGTGRQLTMEEFDMCVGHSPIVQELMRRQNVEERNNDSLDSHTNGINGAGSKSKKKGGWLKSIRSVASVVTGHKERRSSDERDTSSEKGGRRSSSATDDSQDVTFHGPERVRVRQYGKSCKELTAVYKSQEIQAHNGYIWSIKFSLDGRYLASAGEDCVIHVWKVVESERKGDLLMEKQEDGNLNLFFLANGSPEPVSLSPNVDGHPEKKRRGRSSFSRKSLSLEQIMVPETVFALSEKPFRSFQGHLDDVLDLSWSKSQHLLSSSMDKTVRLWHLSSKSCLKVFSHSDYVTCIQFNPVDDRYFISGSLDAKVRIWSIPDRQVVDWNDLHEMVTAACYTPDGQGALVGTYKGNCRIYNTSENKLQRKGQVNLQNKKKKSQHKKITGFQFGPGSSTEVLITSSDSRIRVVDTTDLVHKFKGFHNTNSQISAAITTNGKYVVSASEDSYVYVWKYEADSRASRSKGVTVTHSYEHFHCQDVSVAIPWPGMDIYSGEDEASMSDHPQTPVEEDSSGNESSGLASRRTNSATNNYFFDRTWPEEKLVVAARNRRSPSISGDYSNEVMNPNISAWGMVIVTAGLRGEIRTFQNFGLPVGI